jgi:hypothetical protein
VQKVVYSAVQEWKTEVGATHFFVGLLKAGMEKEARQDEN